MWRMHLKTLNSTKFKMADYALLFTLMCLISDKPCLYSYTIIQCVASGKMCTENFQLNQIQDGRLYAIIYFNMISPKLWQIPQFHRCSALSGEWNNDIQIAAKKFNNVRTIARSIFGNHQYNHADLVYLAGHILILCSFIIKCTLLQCIIVPFF